MDGSQFDSISRKFAGRTTRRDAVRTGGVMAAVAGAFGARSVVRAQDDEDESENCTWAFKAMVIDGPNEDAEYEGVMRVEIMRDGAIDVGALATDTDDVYEVVGNTRGKAISLRVKIGQDLALACTGVGDRDVKSCQGSISGTFAGPEFGDFGVWEITRRANDDDEEDEDDNGTAVATATVASGSNPSPTPGSSNPQPTATACPPEDCGLVKTWDADACECVCYDGGVDCGPDLCCPSGSVCNGTTSCSCPSGTVLCGNACVDDCSSGQILDYNTCTCTNDCPSGQVKCNGQCYGQCGPGEQFNTTTCTCDDICPAGQAFCNGQCKDVVNDKNNCGSCGNVCPPGMPCIAGTCKCPATYKYCSNSDECIPDNQTCP
jgi:hypothetical protein